MTHEQTINDLLDQFEACTKYVDYWPLRSRCVQALDSYEYGVGVGPNRAAQWDRFDRIDARVGLIVSKQAFEGIKTYSLDECAAYTASQAVIADLVCAAVASSTSLDAVGERETRLEAAE